MENTEQIAQIKVLVAKKLNLEQVSLEDCRSISEQIFFKTKNYLSQRTVQTIFTGKRELLTPFSLNSLAQFCEFKNWEDYLKKFK
ncbi:hypothetical protein GCM10022246_17820 [Pedobacter ginsengiterrae]|uniref:Uncharacterized protein n=1 Tax=Pedobacter ginsengiterrae TaxID=871696 RepID=A0ABP7PHL1_9SPHI